MAKKGIVTVKRDLCKGCEICVHFCPQQVLEMNEFKVSIKDADKCIGCMMCELRCPDFAVTVEVIEN